MTLEPFQIQNYDVLKGLFFVGFVILTILLIIYLLSSRALYNIINTYDAQDLLSKKSHRYLIAMLDHWKFVIIILLGYRGEKRERQPFDKIDSSWIIKNTGSILFRLSVFYFMYNWTLTITTRPLLIDATQNSILFMELTRNPILGFSFMLIYIFSNAFFDFLSLYFTLKHIDHIKNSDRLTSVVFIIIKDFLYAFGCFIASQLISNFLWPLKTNVAISFLDRIFSPAIALWPYAFVFNTSSESPDYLPIIFPGQILITGTVFLPTIILTTLSIVLIIAIKLTGLLKRTIIKLNLVRLVVIVTPMPGQPPIFQFRCINTFIVAVTASFLGNLIFQWYEFIF